MSNLAWSKAAFDRLDKFKLQDVPAEWLQAEKSYVERFAAAKAEARKLLNQGKRAEAVKLINDTAAAIWDDAAKLMKL